MSKDKNILIVSPYFYPEGGGLENYAYFITTHLEDRYRFIARSATYKEDAKDPVNNILVYRKKPTFFVSNTPIDFSLGSDLQSLVVSHNIDLIHAHTPVPFFVDMAAKVSKKMQVPFLVTYHNTMLKKGSYTDIIAALYRPIQNSTLRQADHIVTVSNRVKHGYLSKFSSKISVIPPGVNMPKEAFCQKEKNTFMFAGQFSAIHKIKGLDFLLEIFSSLAKEHKELRLYVAGGGPSRFQYEQLAKKMGLSDTVTFLGNLDKKTLNEYYSKAQALIVPSTSDAEGTPTVILEALACSTSVIGADVGGVSELIEDSKDGFLFKAKNEDQLCEILLKCLKDPQMCKNMGEKGQQKVLENFTWDIQAAKYDTLYQEIL